MIVFAATVISSLHGSEKFCSNLYVRGWARPISIDISCAPLSDPRCAAAGVASA